ncbi:hypothetical protein CIB48_g1346 [Xylaria polymorpha]|nr:hypothetical protein CIB48_g1346 [Xylaria polymorpha]
MSDADFDTVRKLQAERNAAATAKKGTRPSGQRTDAPTKAKLTESFDTDLYDRNGGDKYAGYLTSIPTGDDEDDEMEDADSSRRLVGQYTATRAQIDEFAHGNGVEEDDPFAGRGEQSTRIVDRETDYQKRRFDRVLTPTRADAFASNRQAGAADDGRTYRDVMELRELEREEERVKRAIQAKQQEGHVTDGEHRATLQDGDKENADAGSTEAVAAGRKRKKRWDVSSTAVDEPAPTTTEAEAKSKRSRWDQAPALPTPGGTEAPKKRSRWDQAPSATPIGGSGLVTPMHTSQISAGAVPSFGTDISGPSGVLSDEELDTLLPGEAQGYTAAQAPPQLSDRPCTIT